MTSLEHIFNISVVRFSVRFPEHLTSKAFSLDERNSWFSYRARIFQSFLLSSIDFQLHLRQSKRVYLLLDEGDVDLYNTHFTDIPAYVRPVFSSDANKAYQAILKDDSLYGSNDVLAISRIDSDDLIANNYFFEVNKAFCMSRVNTFPCVVVASRGFRTDLKQIQSLTLRFGPFQTLFTQRQNSLHVYGWDHNKVHEKILNIECSDARWIQFLHGNNVSNAFSKLGTSAGASDLLEADLYWPEGFPDLAYLRHFSAC